MNTSVKVIHYIGIYSMPSLAEENRLHSLAATNKMDYICTALRRAGYEVNIVSPAWSLNTGGRYRGRTMPVSPGVSLTLCPSFGAKNKVTRMLRTWFSALWLFLWLMSHLTRGEKIIVYNYKLLSRPVLAARRLKRFSVVLELEEIFHKYLAHKTTAAFARLENAMIESADRFIFPNELVPSVIELKDRPCAVVYGTYECYPRQQEAAHDGICKVVYAGSIDPVKRAALNAVMSSKYLDERYRMYILGNGGVGDVAQLRTLIEELNRTNTCQVSYEGQLSGDEYIRFMQQCQIGLNTQCADGKYFDYTFPSKVLSYLSLGLRVVSVTNVSVVKSRVGDLVTFYETDDPEGIAAAIKSIRLDSAYNPMETIAKLDDDFVTAVKQLLN